MNVFTRSLSDNLASLVKQIDAKVGENSEKQMRGFVVLLTDDPDQAEEDLKAFAKKHKIKNLPLTYFDGISGPRNYRIAKEAETTVNIWKGQTSKANHALKKDELTKGEIAKIVESTSVILK